MLDLTFRGNRLGDSSDCFGQLRRSDDIVDNPNALRTRMVEDGYLYLPGLLDRQDVLDARREVMERLSALGALHEHYPLLEGVYNPGGKTGGMYDFTLNNPPLMKVLYSGPMIAFYERFLGGPVAHFDYTWFRVKAPGAASPTQPHYDIVYMGRGTKNLYTSWTPLGDVPYEMGGLMLLKNSHRLDELKRTYGQSDVDKYCENEGDSEQIVEAARAENRDLTAEERARIRWNSTGSYSADAVEVRSELGGRWLTAEYKLGDLLVFCMHLMHASSDNHTDRIRISSDSRYQLASEPQDERWIGATPSGHGIRSKRGMIC
jgi:hypothetical protein